MEEKQRELLVQHLTKEIEIATQVQLAQRTRNNFTVAIGPFVLLGGYLLAAKDATRLQDVPAGWLVVVAIAFIAVYGFLGRMAGLIELRLWEQCNVWRGQIEELTSAETSSLVFPTHGLVPSYVAIYASMAAVFVLAMWALSLAR